MTCSVRVQIYNAMTRLVVKNLSKFQQQAYGGNFRKDGRLLVAGDEENLIRLFDVSSKNILRLFKGHTAPVHRVFFTNGSDTSLVSFSDDKTCRMWDIPTEKAICTFTDHTDYVRAGCVSTISPNIFLSGGYDHVVRMYDSRAAECVMEMKHESPVESMLMLPSGGTFISAGGTEIKVWDALAGGKLVISMTHHHKTVTSVRLASNGRRLVSGSLDKHVKVFDIATYQSVFNVDLPGPVLAVGVGAEDKLLAAGMVDGSISVQRRPEDTEADEAAITQRRKRFALVEDMAAVDQVVIQEKREHEKRYDKYFRKFEYSKALDHVLRAYYTVKRPSTTVAVIRELIKRKGLERALAGRNHGSLTRFIRFIKLNMGDYRYSAVLTDAAHILLDVYEDQFGTFGFDLNQAFIQLAERLESELKISAHFMELKGAMDMLLNASAVQVETVEDSESRTLQDPSSRAIQKSIISVE